MKIKILYILILVLLIPTSSSFSIYPDKNPHDQEFACNKCHGTNTDYGQPETGKHEAHLNSNNAEMFANFQNESYRDIEDEDRNFITRWDLCDECHYDKNVDKNISSHMDGDVNLKENGFNYTTGRKCKNVDCHPTNFTDPIYWGDQSFPSYSTDSFVSEYIDKNCARCHSSRVDMANDTRETVILNYSVYRLCMDDCHKKGDKDEVKVNHPLGMKPSPILLEAMDEQDVFEKFPLYGWDSTFTCTSCHDPHGESCQTCHFDFDNEKVYPDGHVIKRSTVFLRSTDGNIDEFDLEKHTYGEYPLNFERVVDKLCKVCHDLQTLNRVSIENPHWERQCMHCHKEFPYNVNEVCVSWKVNEYNRVELKEELIFDTKYEIKVLCRECHNSDNHLHPVDVEPRNGTPGDIPLDRWKSVTCYTCHDAHLPYGEIVLEEGMEKKRELPIYRRKGKANDLCQACHLKDEKYKKTDPHSEKKCRFCHVVPSELEGTSEFSYDSNIINRCNLCHQEDKNTHPVNIVPVMDLVGFPLSIENKINCATCHTSHDPEKLLFTWKIKKGEKSYCFNCHE